MALGSAPPAADAREIDLRGLTVMPGWIDTHVHVSDHLDPSGNPPGPSESAGAAMLGLAANAWAILEGGFTTVQSVGSPSDRELRDAIESGAIPGPRRYRGDAQCSASVLQRRATGAAVERSGATVCPLAAPNEPLIS